MSHYITMVLYSVVCRSFVCPSNRRVCFACSGVASICLGALQVKALANCLLSIPTWMIIGTVSAYNIYNGVSEFINQEMVAAFNNCKIFSCYS